MNNVEFALQQLSQQVAKLQRQVSRLSTVQSMYPPSRAINLAGAYKGSNTTQQFINNHLLIRFADAGTGFFDSTFFIGSVVPEVMVYHLYMLAESAASGDVFIEVEARRIYVGINIGSTQAIESDTGVLSLSGNTIAKLELEVSLTTLGLASNEGLTVRVIRRPTVPADTLGNNAYVAAAGLEFY
jgi:hypothetical protein